MTVSHLTRTRDQLWSDLLVALGGSEAFLTRSISERKVLLEILDTYSSSVSLLTIDDVDALLAAVVIAAGGSASHLRQNKHEMLAALVTALGGTAPSPSSSSTGELLAACVNAADTVGGDDYTIGALRSEKIANGNVVSSGAITIADARQVTMSMFVRWDSPTLTSPAENEGFGTRVLENGGFPGSGAFAFTGVTSEIYADFWSSTFGEEFTPTWTTVMDEVETIDYSGWHHFLLAVDLDHGIGAKPNHLFIDGVEIASANIDADDVAFDCFFNFPDYLLISFKTNKDPNQAVEIADVWMDTVFIDPTNPANVAKFYSAGPVNLGADGSTPTGSQPKFFFTTARDGSVADFLVNKGSAGGTWAFVGDTPAGLATTSPSD